MKLPRRNFLHLAAGEDRGNMITDQISRKCRQAAILSIRITIYDPDVLALNIASFF